MFYSLAHELNFLAQVNLSARLSYSSFEATMLRAMCGHSNNNGKPQGGSIKNSVSHANNTFGVKQWISSYIFARQLIERLHARDQTSSKCAFEKTG